jgi:siderophore synthetase component
VLHDLVDVLFLENLFGILDRGRLLVSAEAQADLHILNDLPLDGDEQWFWLPLPSELSGNEALSFRVRPAPLLGRYRLSRPPVMLCDVDSQQTRPLVPAALFGLLANRFGADWPNLAGVLRDLQIAVSHTARSLRAEPAVTAALAAPEPSLIVWERAAALRDRPVHPTAKAKQGWDNLEYARYSPEFARPFPLAWVAVRRDHLVGGEGLLDPAHALLDPVQQQQLATALSAVVQPDDYLPLPVHPWQLAHVLPRLFDGELATGVCVPLAAQLGSFLATSSVRTLAPVLGGDTHVKLPLGICSLGALRLLPRRYLHNATRAQALLGQVIDRHPLLAKRVRLCDERQWWAFSAGPGDHFDDKPGHLACMLRAYPAGLLSDPGVTVLPLAALAAVGDDGRALGLRRLLACRPSEETTAPAALALFEQVCERLTEVALAYFAHGLMPELHGQNVLLVVRDGDVESLVLRDHDTVRIHPGWLARVGLADPAYLVKPNSPNTLILDEPEALLVWFQTLTVQVSLHPVALALHRDFGVEEVIIWQALAHRVRRCLSELDLPRPVRDAAQRELLERDTWPTKLVLGPLLERDGSDGSMPSGLGEISNPLRTAARLHHTTLRWSEQAAIERLLNTYVRESPGCTLSCDVAAAGAALPVRIRFPATGAALLGSLTYRSSMGHHVYGDRFWVLDGETSQARAARGLHDVASLVLGELGAAEDDPTRRAGLQEDLLAQINNSVDKTARYLQRRLAETEPITCLDATDPLLAAEQSLLLGHPFHPTPKSSEGFTHDELERYAPELRACYQLHWFAAASDLTADTLLPGGAAALSAIEGPVRARLDGRWAACPLLPVHPWQARHLAAQPEVQALAQAGRLVALGPHGGPVHPTSSVRTVLDTAAGMFLKLALSVRITNFVRVNTPEQLLRSIDASRAVQALAPELRLDGLTILLERAARTLRVPDGLSAGFGLLVRDGPPPGSPAPMVVAALLEADPRHGLPPLVEAIHRAAAAAGGPPGIAFVRRWLDRYLQIFLAPLLQLLIEGGVGLEAHTQNTLLAVEAGWPVRCYVRDLEGASCDRDHPRARDGYGGLLAADSPALYGQPEVWQRFSYYVVVNHVGQLIATIARHLDLDESALWPAVRQAVSAQTDRVRGYPGAAPLSDLLDGPNLPAKANLSSRFLRRGEQPLYVGVPNPLRAEQRS